MPELTNPLRRQILHLDIDAFLASIEQILEPSLMGKPVAVGFGCVASRSYEAKAKGVHTAMSMQEARLRCPDLIIRDGDARVVEQFRERVAGLMRERIPLVEVCSLDDMYGDLTGLPLVQREGAVALAKDLRRVVRAATHLSVAQGIGPSKVVARMATVHAKPGGILEIAPSDVIEFLDTHEIDALPGVGRKTAALLHDLNVHTVAELRAVDLLLLERTFGKRGRDLYWRSRGRDAAPRDDHSSPVRVDDSTRTISRETSFSGTDEREFLFGMLAYLLDRAAADLRGRALQSRRVFVRVRFVDGQGTELSASLKRGTCRTDLLLDLARGLLERELDARRVLVRLVGVTLAALTERVEARQALLFDDGEAVARDDLFAAIDALRNRHGFGMLVLGEAATLLGRLPNGKGGFRLRTPSLSQ